MEKLYIIDKSEKFKGNVLNTMPFVEIGAKNGKDILNDTYVDYCDGETFGKYNERHGGNLIALTWDQFNDGYYTPYLNQLQGKFKPISKKQWYYYLECVPPKKWHDIESGINVFYVGECYTANLYTCCIRLKNGKKENHFAALRAINTPDQNLKEQVLKLTVNN